MNKQKNKQKNIFLIYLVLTLLILPPTFGIGISPATTNIQFQPNLEKEITLQIHNKENKNTELAMYITGDLKDYFNIDENTIKIKKNESIKKLKLALKLPEEFSTPGLKATEINFQDINDLSKQNTLHIQTKLVLSHQVFIHIPYEGKYAEVHLKANNVKIGETALVYIKIMNLGEENINNAYAEINILDKDGKSYQEFRTESKSILSRKVGELFFYIDTKEYKPGDYYINASINYDGKIINKKSSFTMDDFMLELISIGSSNFKLGEIAKFSILLKNIGNRLIKDASTFLLFKDENEKIIGEMSSVDIELKPNSIGETVAFWDTRNINVGDYQGSIRIDYEEKSAEKDIKAKLTEDKLEVTLISDITGMAISNEKREENNKTTLLTTLVFILIIITSIILVLEIKRRKK